MGAGAVDIRSILGTILNVIKSRANQVCASTCDGLILRMHYRWTFCFLMGGFLTVWYSWFHREVITCAVHFNADNPVRTDYMNICLSYPYVEEGKNKEKRYLLFYRWISWSLLVLAGIYYIPRKVSKNLDNVRCKKLLEDLAANAHRYDQTEKELVERAARYIIFNLKTHDGLYWKFLSVNFLALLVDLFAMFYLDFILQGRFIQYGFKSYPFDRDPEFFTDYMSQTFPPFASCQLSEEVKLLAARSDKVGCHLTIMELYEKIFLGLWLWLIILMFLTCCYIVFLMCMWLPFVKAHMLRTAKPAHASDMKVRGIIHSVVQNCKIGDIYLLYRLKGHLSHARFYELLNRLSDPNLFNKQLPQGGPNAPNDEDKMMLNKQADNNLRNRRANNPPQDPHMNPDYLQLLTNPEMISRHPKTLDPGTLLLKKGGTSILIE